MTDSAGQDPRKASRVTSRETGRWQRHFWRADVPRDVDDEIRFHIEQRVQDLTLRGLSPGEARLQAEQEFGDRPRIRQEMLTIDGARERVSQRLETLADFRQDLRFALRGLRRSPAFSVMAIACIALGVAVTTTIFAAVNGVLIRPLPFEKPDELVTIYSQYPERGITGTNISWPDYRSWRESSRSFTSMGIWTWTSLALSGDGQPERIEAANVSADVFSLLGVHPVLGRSFAADDERPGNDRVILLSHDLWMRRYAGDSSIVGRKITVDALPYVVVGVMPPRFNFPERGQAWTPFSVNAAEEEHGNRGYAAAIARLKPGVSSNAAQTDLNVVSQQLARDFPQDNRGWSAQVVELRTDLAGDLRRPLLVFLAAVAFVLLIASANVANLMLARGASKEQETAVRMALGAGRGRIIRSVLAESVLISLTGGAIGLLLTRGGLQVLERVFPDGTPYFFALSIDGTVLLFAVALTAITAFLFGLLPAFGATRADLQSRLRDGTRSAGGQSRSRLRKGLVMSEVALSVVLLIGATLLMRSYQALLATDLGFDTSNILTARYTLPVTRYTTAEARRQFAERVQSQVAALPGVERVGAARGIPFSGWNVQGEMSVEGKPGRRAGDDLVVHFQSVSADYFRTMGTPLRSGRMFTAADRDTAQQVGIINETLAKLEFSGTDPIGRRIKSGSIDEDHPWVTIVGVVKDIRQYRLPQKMGPALYFPQTMWPSATQTIVIRTRSDPLDLTPSVRAIFRSLDSDIPLYTVQSMQQAVDRSLWRQRAQGQILLTFALLALLLAAVGMYGVVSWSVTQRRREVGIRMALGSTRLRVARLIVGDSMRLTLAGIVIGVAGALALSRVLAELLYGVSVFDVATFAVVPCLLASVAAFASWLPARRAMRVDPSVAMRAE